MRRHYTTATLALLQEDQDISAVLAGLKQAMERRGHTHLYERVLQDVAQAWERYEEQRTPLVQLARETDASKLAARITKQLAQLKAPAEYRVAVTPELIGGSVVHYNHRVVDSSYKNALLRLYQNVTQSSR